MLARARSRRLSRLDPPRDTPTIGKGAWPRLSIQCKAGKIFLNARSPVAPKRTKASESGSAIAHPYKARLAEEEAGAQGARRRDPRGYHCRRSAAELLCSAQKQ